MRNYNGRLEDKVVAARIVPGLRRNWGVALFGVAVLLHLLLLGSLFWEYLNPLFGDSDLHPQGTDFFAVYEGGRNAIEDRSLFFYDPQDTSSTPYHTPYRYLPGLAYVVGVPSNAVPAWWAYWAWVACTELLLVLTVYGTWRIAGRGNVALVAAAMWMAFTPYFVELYMGQFSFVMAVALFWTGVGVARGERALAAVPWIASLVTKSSSAVLVPLFVRLGWWRPLGGAALVVALALLYFAFRPGEVDYFLWLNSSGTIGETQIGLLELEPSERQDFFYVDQDVRFFHYQPGELGAVAFLTNSLLTRDSASTMVPSAYTGTLAAAVVISSLVATFLARRNDALALFAIWSSVLFLIYPVWEHHYVMLLPALVLLVVQRPGLRAWTLLAFVFVAAPTPYWLMNNVWNTGPAPPSGMLISPQEVWPAWGVILYHGVKAVPVFVFWAFLVTRELRSGLRIPGAGFVRAPVGPTVTVQEE